MVHCHCSTVHGSSPNLPVNFPVAGVGLRLPSHRHSLIGKQLPKQAQQNGLKGSQTGLAASASRAVTRVIPRRSVSTAAHHRSVCSKYSVDCIVDFFVVCMNPVVVLSCSDADQDLVVSLYWPYKNLPPDGKVISYSAQLSNHCTFSTPVLHLIPTAVFYIRCADISTSLSIWTCRPDLRMRSSAILRKGHARYVIVHIQLTSP